MVQCPTLRPPVDIPVHAHHICAMRYAKPYHDAVALQRMIMSSANDCQPKDLLERVEGEDDLPGADEEKDADRAPAPTSARR